MRFFQMVFGPAGAKEPVIYLPLVKDNRLVLVFFFFFLSWFKTPEVTVPCKTINTVNEYQNKCSNDPTHLHLPAHLHLILIPTYSCLLHCFAVPYLSLPPPPPPINLLCSVFIPPSPPPPSAPSHPHLSAFLPHYIPPPPSAPSHPFSLTSHFCQ